MRLDRAFLLAILLGFAACAEITPASLTGEDDPGEEDGDGDDGDGDGSGGSGADAGPGDVEGGEGDTCDYEAAVSTSKRVRVLYLVPSDRDEDPGYTHNLEQALRHTQQWFRAKMPASTHFTVNDPVVQVAKTTHPAAWYSTNVVGDDQTQYFWENALADAGVLGASLDDPDNLWLVYVAADTACGQSTYGWRHIAMFPENDLRGLAGRTRVPPCGGAPDGYGRCRWVGGMALVMALSVGLTGEPGCADADTMTPCDDTGLMRYGYISYPTANLTTAQLTYLDDSQFLDGTGLPACDLGCAVALE